MAAFSAGSATSSPLLQMGGGFSAASISLLMILAGGGMVVGNQVSALLADPFQAWPPPLSPILGQHRYCSPSSCAPFGWISVALMFVCCVCLFVEIRFARAVPHCEARQRWRNAGWMRRIRGASQPGQCRGRFPRWYSGSYGIGL